MEYSILIYPFENDTVSMKIKVLNMQWVLNIIKKEKREGEGELEREGEIERESTLTKIKMSHLYWDDHFNKKLIA